MFNVTAKDIGTVHVAKEVVIEFPYTNIFTIDRIESPCDCAKVYNHVKEKKLVIKYLPKKVKHLTTYETTKRFTISYTPTGGIEGVQTISIQFTAKVID